MLFRSINDNINDNKNKDKESKYCCICLNTNKDNFIKLKCCKQFIHKGCIIELVVNNDVFNCPICRSKIKLCDSITFGKIIDYINYKKILVSSEKMKTIITHLYNSYQFKLLFNMENTDIAEINHLKKTVTKLMIENSKLKCIILIILIPLIISIIIIVNSAK